MAPEDDLCGGGCGQMHSDCLCAEDYTEDCVGCGNAFPSDELFDNHAGDPICLGCLKDEEATAEARRQEMSDYRHRAL